MLECFFSCYICVGLFCLLLVILFLFLFNLFSFLVLCIHILLKERKNILRNSICTGRSFFCVVSTFYTIAVFVLKDGRWQVWTERNNMCFLGRCIQILEFYMSEVNREDDNSWIKCFRVNYSTCFSIGLFLYMFLFLLRIDNILLVWERFFERNVARLYLYWLTIFILFDKDCGE